MYNYIYLKPIFIKEPKMQIIKQTYGGYEIIAIFVTYPKELDYRWSGTDALYLSKTCKNPLAILNTHGHYDHIWDNAKVKRIQHPYLYS